MPRHNHQFRHLHNSYQIGVLKLHITNVLENVCIKVFENITQPQPQNCTALVYVLLFLFTSYLQFIYRFIYSFLLRT